MFDIGWSELLVIAVVAIVVVGPKDLPPLMRTFGKYAGKLRRAASDFQRQFEDAMRETEMEEVKKAIESVRDETSSIDLKASIDKPIMVPKPPPATPAAPTNGKGAAGAEAAPAEVAPDKVAPKRKRAAKPKTAVSKETAAKTPRSRKRKAEPESQAEPKPPKAEPKP
jgi:sec-independent protein translocase protein TatB